MREKLEARERLLRAVLEEARHAAPPSSVKLAAASRSIFATSFGHFARRASSTAACTASARRCVTRSS